MFGWPKQNCDYCEDCRNCKQRPDTQTPLLEVSVKESRMFHAACLLDNSTTINSTWSYSMHVWQISRFGHLDDILEKLWFTTCLCQPLFLEVGKLEKKSGDESVGISFQTHLKNIKNVQYMLTHCISGLVFAGTWKARSTINASSHQSCFKNRSCQRILININHIL